LKNLHLPYNKNLNFDEQIFKDYLEERKNLSKASNNLFIFGMSYLILKIKKYFFGNFYFSSSLPVLIIASLVTIISDYPFLKKISRQFNDKIDNFFIYLGLLLAFIREGDLTLFLLFTKSLIESFNAYSGLQVQKQFIKNCSIGMQVEKIDKKGEKITLPASVIKPGDEIIVSENNIIRFDGIIIEGQALVNHVYYNGRCVIEQFKENDNVKHGMYIIKGKIKIRITKRIDYTPKEDIELNQMSIYKRAKNYQEKQLLVSTLFAFTGWVLTGSIITPLSIYLVMGPAAADFAVKSGLGLYLKKLRDRGIILRNVNKMEKIRDVDIIVFDKTGTLSSNNLVINNIEVINDNFSENKVKKIFSCCEKGILHPIANSIEIDFDDNIIQDKEYIPGKGIRAVYKNNEVLVGNEKLMKMSNIEITLRENKKPGIDIYVAVEGSLIARVVLTEVVNDQAFKMIEKLKSLNLELAIISGDRQENLSYVADSLGVKNYQGDMSYDKKRKFIKQLKKNNNNVIMVGDGINDTGAMKAADISITFRREDINLVKSGKMQIVFLEKRI